MESGTFSPLGDALSQHIIARFELAVIVLGYRRTEEQGRLAKVGHSTQQEACVSA